MTKYGLVWTLVFGAAIGGCQGESACDQSGDARAFGACCTADSQCADGVCHEFGDGMQVCTKKCAAAGDCPAGTQGQKCNNQGVCRY